MKNSLLLAYFLAVSAFCINSAVSDTITISGVMRDFWPANEDGSCMKVDDCGHQDLPADQQFDCVPSNCHRDFERLCCGQQTGVVESYLDSDKKPILKPESEVPGGYEFWSSPEEFAQWYRDVPGVNIPFTVNLTLKNSDENPNVYGFSSSSFFPLNGMGYGNFQSSKNYHFTTEIKARFTYWGGEVFNFTGDDDVFVFINDQLVVDIGGVHSAITRSINVDTLGLTVGVAYTSLDLYCSYYDHCGVCQGDGQSCCTCNDGNPCTLDKCHIFNSTCIYTPIQCPGSNKCLNYYCDSTVPGPFSPATHCKTEPYDCDDDNACTDDGCNPDNGCTNQLKNCDDNDACTSDSCNTQTGCLNTPIDCDDGNPCTSDSCDSETGCQNIAMSCNDNNACTADSCNSQTGCSNTPISCDDNNFCTTDSCDSITGCRNQPISCNDNNACTTQYCDPAIGCVYDTVNCDDGDACTVDSCTTQTGCVHSPRVCNDGDPCTVDKCIPETGCDFSGMVADCTLCHDGTNPLVICNTSNACAPEECDPADGLCKPVPVDCTSSNLCNTLACVDYGDGNYACEVVDTVTCSSTNLCIPQVCNPTTGLCEDQPEIECDDGSACTDDTCNPLTGECEFVYICSNADPCNPEACINRTCVAEPVNCDDGNTCTTDYCDSATGQCVHDPIICNVTDYCQPQKCVNSIGCVEIDFLSTCDDNNKCTEDLCVVNGTTPQCAHQPVVCDDGDPCTIDSCSASIGCVFTPKVCDDNSVCTNSTCDPETGECVHIPIPLPPTDACTTSYCDDVLGIISNEVICRPPDKCSCHPVEGCQCSGLLFGEIPVESAAIGAGVIAAIVIGVVVGIACIAVGGKGGYELYKRLDKESKPSITTNPLYEEKGDFQNPLYSDDAL